MNASAYRQNISDRHPSKPKLHIAFNKALHFCFITLPTTAGVAMQPRGVLAGKVKQKCYCPNMRVSGTHLKHCIRKLWMKEFPTMKKSNPAARSFAQAGRITRACNGSAAPVTSIGGY